MEKGCNWHITTSRFTHGTARLESKPSAVPVGKQETEKFWVKALLAKLPESSEITPSVETNPDDSSGGHDVILNLGEKKIGIQVTELTSELKRQREDIRQKYLSEVVKILSAQSIAPKHKVLICIYFTDIDSENLKFIKPVDLANIILTEIKDGTVFSNTPFSQGSIIIEPIPETTFYVPNVGNIGIDINFDELSISFDTYKKAIDYLSDKKKKSKSPWLLIWSLEFWIIKADHGACVLEYLKSTFSTSSFERVFFAESLGGEGLFEANLEIHQIKG